MSSSAQNSISGFFEIGQKIANRLYFEKLGDTPTGYLGHSGDYLVVNNGETGIHFTGIEKIAQDLTDYGFSAGETTFTGLSDTPSDFTAGKYLRVNDAGNALEYVDITGGDATSYIDSVVTKTENGPIDKRSTDTTASSTNYYRVPVESLRFDDLEVGATYRINVSLLGYHGSNDIGSNFHIYNRASSFSSDINLDSAGINNYNNNGGDPDPAIITIASAGNDTTTYGETHSQTKIFEATGTHLDVLAGSISSNSFFRNIIIQLEKLTVGGGSAGSDLTDFVSLTDTPVDYIGHSGDYMIVNDNETGIHFTGIEKIAQDLTNYGFGGDTPIPKYIELPNATNNDNKIVASGCDLYYSCDGTWRKISAEEMPPPDNVPGCVVNQEEYSQYQEYRDRFLAENSHESFDQMLNFNNDISDLIYDVCLFSNSDLSTVIIDETNYKWGMFNGTQTVNITATPGDQINFSHWAGEGAVFGDISSSQTTLLVDKDLSVTGYFVGASETACVDTALHIQSDTTDASNIFKDLSNNDYPVMAFGNVQHSTSDAYLGTTSMTFDGAGDYLQIGNTSTFKFLHDGTTDYTVECWVNFSTISSGLNPIIGTAGNSATIGFSLYYAGSTNNNNEWRALMWKGSAGVAAGRVDISGIPETNRWYHVAAVHKSNTLYFYIDGVLGGSDSSGGYSPDVSFRELRIGSVVSSTTGSIVYSDCRIQDVRISKKAIYTSNFTPSTTLLGIGCLPEIACEDIALHVQSDTTNGSTSFTDLSSNAHSITRFGDTQHTTTNAYLGSTSMRFDGNGDYLTVGNSSDFNFGSSDYTIEFWVNTPNTISSNQDNLTQVIGKHTTASVENSAFLLFHKTNEKRFTWAPYGTAGNVSVDIPDNTWVHIAIVRNGSNLRAYKDGVVQDENTSTGSINNSTATTSIGAIMNDNSPDNFGYPGKFNGYLQDIRITNKAIYTSNFTPPNSLLNNLC